jgi:hypothetical protein
MRGFAISLVTSLALILAGNAWAGKDEASAKPGSGGAAASNQSEKAMESANAQWKDSAQKGKARADSAKDKGAEQVDSAKDKGAEMKDEAEAKAGKPSEAPGKRDEGALER